MCSHSLILRQGSAVNIQQIRELIEDGRGVRWSIEVTVYAPVNLLNGTAAYSNCIVRMLAILNPRLAVVLNFPNCRYNQVGPPVMHLRARRAPRSDDRRRSMIERNGAPDSDVLAHRITKCATRIQPRKPQRLAV